MAIHSSTLAWRIPWTEEPCGLQSMGKKKKEKWLVIDKLAFAITRSSL